MDIPYYRQISMRFVRSRARIGYLACLVAVLVSAACIMRPAEATSAGTKSQPFAGYTKFVRYRVNYQVNADGTHVETHEWALKVLAPQGISEADHASISFSQRLQSAKILSAYTLKKDGHRINVPRSNFQEQLNKGRGKAAPMFSDIKTKTVAFPDVEAGDTVVLSYRLTQQKATFPGNFSFVQSFSKFEVYDKAQISLSAPASLHLRVYARGVHGGKIASKGNRQNWLWSYQNKQVAVPEIGAVSPLDYGPVIVASTFKNYAALAAAYNVRAKSKAAVTNRIRKLAAKLTKNAHTPRQQTKLLYQWVAANIQFAGNCVGVGSVVPHSAARVLANRMGDCKDHSTLLKALLAAKGIESTPALINAGAVYSLPPVPAIGIFNHVINYIPSFNLYADSTAKFVPFGSLPFSDSDKPVIYTEHFVEIRRTPPSSYKDNRSHYTTDLTIHPDGSAVGKTSVEATGLVATALRALMAYIRPNMKSILVQRALAHNGFTGTGTLTGADPQALTPSYEYSSSYKVSDAVNLPGPGAFRIRSPFSGSGSLATFVAGANLPARTVNFQCFGATVEDQYTIQFPKNVHVLAIPKSVDAHGRNIEYKATYRLKGNTVTVIRKLQDRTPGSVCTPADARALKSFAPAVQRDLRAQIVYR